MCFYIFIDPCVGIDCGENGECAWDSQTSDTKCNCLNGFTGTKCDKDPCVGIDCGENGECAWDSKTSDTKCNCLNGFRGIKCDKDPCTGVDCGKNGKCAFDKNANAVKCECKMGWAGNKCETEMEKCDPSPCKNGGTCWKTDSDLVCSCTQYFTGKYCEKNIWCENYGEKICGGIPCYFNTQTEVGYCSCESDDSYFDRESKTCKTIEDQCTVLKFKGNCSLEHETCSKGKCECEENYIYSKTMTGCEPDFCGKKRNKNMCAENEECLDLGGGKISCVCKDGFYALKGVCKEVDRCAPIVSNCSQMCKRSTGECSCSTGFKLNDDKQTCSIMDEENSCAKDCGPGVCIKVNNKEKCICPQNTHSAINGTCLDKCTANKVPANMCPGKQCLPNEEHGFICKCEGLYEQHPDGFHCKRKLMCTANAGEKECLRLSATCVEDPADDKKGYHCICDKRYEPDENGICTKKCDIKQNRDTCDKQFALCTLDSQYEVVCKCPPFLRRLRKNGPCNEIDQNSFIGNLTIKKDRYKTAEKYFAKKINEAIDYVKLAVDLEESLQGVYADFRDAKLLDCKENSNSLFCAVELQFGDTFAKEQVNLITAPSICTALDDTHCWIKPNLVLERKLEEKVFQKTDPCMPIVKQALCGDTTICSSSLDSKSFQCTCAEGFYSMGSYNPTTNSETFIQKCLDIDECLNSTSCPNNTECLNTFGSYKCLCKNGYRKAVDTEDPKVSGCIAVCEPNPCLQGTCVQVGNHGFACDCGSSYTGYLCNSTNAALMDYKKKGNQKAAAVGGVLGALLLITLVAGYLLCRRLQKRIDENDSYSQRQRNIFTEITRQRSTADDIEGKREQRLQSGAYQKGYGRGSEDGSLELHETPLKRTREKQHENKAYQNE
ncbi:neurogenic locus notch homolog protein 1-like isoform X2 [Uloborus diversus]|uniref:neurogenic locus notch homolog protein 1-like isoform X2 n=1 Tax=Uloborus diversus TaxID=327109 RepID=UPI002409C7E2|nr:neurogenic locus notch homolog protein 1-like isoform X2 [Uloborus diversus]